MAEAIPAVPQFKPLFAAQQALTAPTLQKQVSAFEQGIPLAKQRTEFETKRLEGEKQTTEDRFSSIMERLKGREQEEIGRTQQVQSREFGRRGIPLSSGVFEQTLEEKTSPISRFYGVEQAEAGYQKEAALRDISNQIGRLSLDEQQAVMQIAQQVATARGQHVRDAVGTALQLYNTRSDIRQQALNRAAQERLAAQKQQHDIDLQKFIDQLARNRAAVTGGGAAATTGDPSGLRADAATIIANSKSFADAVNKAKQIKDANQRSRVLKVIEQTYPVKQSGTAPRSTGGGLMPEFDLGAQSGVRSVFDFIGSLGGRR